MKKLMIIVLGVFFSVLNLLGQTPQNINLGDDENKSLWDSTSAIIFAAAIILLLIVGRTWSKKVRQKRDEISRKDKEE